MSLSQVTLSQMVLSQVTICLTMHIDSFITEIPKKNDVISDQAVTHWKHLERLNAWNIWRAISYPAKNFILKQFELM